MTTDARALPKSLTKGSRPPGIITDRGFRVLALAAGLMVLVVLALIAIYTTREAWPWFREEGLGIFTDNWDPARNHFGALGLIYGTLLVSVIALVLALPVSVGIALFVTEVAPLRVRRPIVYTVDLLAAIPSVVYGLWALLVLAEPLASLFGSVSDATASVPILSSLFGNPSASGKSFMTAGIIVAIMITPIITSITREVFATVPESQKEGALALGATRWEMIRGAVFPHSRSGMVAASMIGLGRALGETIAVALIIGSSQRVTSNILGPGDTLASVIANQFGEASGTHRAALIGCGVVLFAMTILIGVTARSVTSRAEVRSAGTA
ncbi:MAG TPA: phosphate ABC transporter permease subunit PstC [Acidimicrobiia bacterium]|jgi:phosphate transport system permease protein